MANCKEFMELTPLEKSNYIGSLVHIATNDSEIYLLGQKLIAKGIKKGLFQNVIINPPNPIAPEEKKDLDTN